jgi:hypothetical protein
MDGLSFGAIPSKTYGEDCEQDRDLSGELIGNHIGDRGKASYLSAGQYGVYLPGVSRHAAAAAYVYADGDSYGGDLCVRQHDQ